MRYFNFRRITLVIAAGLTSVSTLAVFVSPALATTISPPRLELAGDPGTVVNGEIKLASDKTTTQTYYLFSPDFQARDESGNPQFVSTSDGLDSWLKFAPAID